VPGCQDGSDLCGFRVSCKTAGNAGGDHGAAQLDGPAGGVPLDQLGGGGAGSVLTMATTIVIAHTCGADLEEDVRFSSHDRLRRPWRRQERGAADHGAAERERRLEHGC